MKDNFFYSSDLTLISTLYVQGHKLEGIERKDDVRCEFVMERDENLDKNVQEFFAGEAKINPVAFASTQKLLKTRLYNVNQR
jgi:hypothetical protein